MKSNEEVFALIDKLRASGVRSYRDGELVIELDRNFREATRVPEDPSGVLLAAARGQL